MILILALFVILFAVFIFAFAFQYDGIPFAILGGGVFIYWVLWTLQYIFTHPARFGG